MIIWKKKKIINDYNNTTKRKIKGWLIYVKSKINLCQKTSRKNERKKEKVQINNTKNKNGYNKKHRRLK